MAKKILITGGTGTVGMRLTEILQQGGHTVSHLSRGKAKDGIKTYRWDIDKFQMDAQAILENDVIVHLAGAGVFDKSWTPAYRKQIVDSRVRSTALLHDTIFKSKKKLDAFVCASAIGIYGSDTTDIWYEENATPATGFLADVVTAWETGADTVAALGIRTVKVRIGIVLSKTGGALEQLALPIKFGVGAKLGTGAQWTPWIHIDDLCRVFAHAIANERMTGVYNAVHPNPLTNEALTKEIAKILHRPLWIPLVPAFVLELILGKEKAAFVLGGSRVSPQKLLATGFHFKFRDIEAALKDVLK